MSRSTFSARKIFFYSIMIHLNGDIMIKVNFFLFSLLWKDFSLFTTLLLIFWTYISILDIWLLISSILKQWQGFQTPTFDHEKIGRFNIAMYDSKFVDFNHGFKHLFPVISNFGGSKQFWVFQRSNDGFQIDFATFHEHKKKIPRSVFWFFEF